MNLKHSPLLLVLLTCTMVKAQEDKKELELTVTKTEWSTTVSENGFGNLYLEIEGLTNGKLVTVETRGNGVMCCKELELAENNRFSGKVCIAFHPRWDTIPRKYSTWINVYEKSESPEIVYCRTGERIRKKVESGLLSFEEKK